MVISICTYQPVCSDSRLKNQTWLNNFIKLNFFCNSNNANHQWGWFIRYFLELPLNFDLTYILFKKFICFYWRTIALQNFVVLSQTSTWISHGYTYIPLLFDLPFHLLPHPTARLIQSPSLSFLSHASNSHLLSILHMVM